MVVSCRWQVLCARLYALLAVRLVNAAGGTMRYALCAVNGA
jgi:hypothetical protein